MRQTFLLLLLFAANLCAHAQRSGRALIPFNGGTLSVEGPFIEGQKGPLKTVIFLHAGFQDLSMWDQSPIPGYRQLYVDLPGHGNTVDGPRRPNADSILLAVYEHFDLKKAALVGLSYGSAIALEFASRHPERVTRLVMASPGLEGFDEVQPLLPSTLDAFSQMMTALEQKDTMRAAKSFVLSWYLGPQRKVKDVPKELYDYGLQTTLQNMRQHHASGWPEFEKPTTMHRVGAVKLPVLLMIGNRDMPEVLRVANWLKQNLPDAVLVRFPKAAHMINLEAPHRFNVILKNFLTAK